MCNLPLCQTSGTSSLPSSTLMSCSRSPLRLGIWKRLAYSPAVLWYLGCCERNKTLPSLTPWSRLPTGLAHSSFTESNGQDVRPWTTSVSGPWRRHLIVNNCFPPAIPSCQSLFQNYPEALSKSSSHSSRPTSSKSIDQWAGTLHPHRARHHCLALRTQPGQPPVLQETT